MKPKIGKNEPVVENTIRELILIRIEEFLEETEEDLQISVFEDMSDKILVKTFEEIVRQLERNE